MSKIRELFETAKHTKVEEGNRLSFLFFFALTYGASYSFRTFPAFGRATKKALALLPHPSFVISNNTGTFSVRSFNDTMTTSSDHYDADKKPWLAKPAKKRVFLDVGANIGRYSIIAAKEFKYEKVIAIEANPFTYSILQKNIVLNKLDASAHARDSSHIKTPQVTALQCAASDKEGMLKFQFDPYHLGGGNVTKEASEEAPSSVINIKAEVRAAPLDILLKESTSTGTGVLLNVSLNFAEIDFIKIDVERLELEVLNGMSNILNAMEKDSYVMLEVSNYNIEKVSSLFKEHSFELSESKENDFLYRKI